MIDTGAPAHPAAAAAAAPAAIPRLPADPTTTAPRDARELSRVLLLRLAELEEGTAQYQYTRHTLIELNISLVRFAARRFGHRGDQQEDIVQVGTIGLIKAIDRFDPDRGTEFTTYAVPCIVGEIRRHFRDTTWAVHVPRRLQERRIALARATEQLEGLTGRAPTVRELAAHLELDAEDVVEAQVAAGGYTAQSLEATLEDQDGDTLGVAHRDRLGACDPELEKAENLQALKPLLARLGDRDRRILEMRFGAECTQSEIAAALGISQMHVSRLLAACIGRLRAELSE